MSSTPSCDRTRDRQLISERMALLNADYQLNSLKDYAEQDNGRAKCGNEQIGMPCRIVIMRHAAGHAHETQHIQGMNAR